MTQAINRAEVSPISRQMDKGISEITGRADLASGGSMLAYRALRPLLCSACGMMIAEGALFTRHKVKGIGVSIMPRCQKCEPFALRASKEEKSTLLKSLLAGQQSPSLQNSGSPANEPSRNSSKPLDDEKNLAEEVRKRLGPALKRSRRG